MSNVARTIALAVVLLPCWGCGSDSSAPPAGSTVPIKGKVTFKGQPVTGGDIQFEPTDSGRPANGKIQPDGTFTMTTFKEGDGAVPGTHRVAVSGNVKLPARYKTPSSSKTEVEVTAGKTEYTIDFK
jgi:hypothetical protein